MTSNPARARRRLRRDQRGAVVVEAAIVVSLFLIPMLLGVLTFGYKIWQLQKYDPYEPRIYASQIVGVFDCIGLVDRVENTVRNNIAGLGVPVNLSWIDAVVVEADDTGVLVDVTVTVPYPDGSGDAAVLKSATRLENVDLSSIAC